MGILLGIFLNNGYISVYIYYDSGEFTTRWRFFNYDDHGGINDDHGGMRLQQLCRDVVGILPTRLDECV